MFIKLKKIYTEDKFVKKKKNYKLISQHNYKPLEGFSIIDALGIYRYRKIYDTNNTNHSMLISYKFMKLNDNNLICGDLFS